jgi:hypothetical protein
VEWTKRLSSNDDKCKGAIYCFQYTDFDDDNAKSTVDYLKAGIIIGSVVITSFFSKEIDECGGKLNFHINNEGTFNIFCK